MLWAFIEVWDPEILGSDEQRMKSVESTQLGAFGQFSSQTSLGLYYLYLWDGE